MTDWFFPFCPSPPGWNLDRQAVEAAFDWIRALRGCPQNPVFHGEGDVLAHTRLVVENLCALDEWRNLSPSERSVLFAAALLHDVAKPECTVVEADGRITSRGHGRKGTYKSRRILWTEPPFDAAPVPFACRETVAALVRFSGLPFKVWERENPVREVIRASHGVRCDLLAILEKADALGRICADQAELLEKVELFRELCLEWNCLTDARAFPNDRSRFLYFQKPNTDPSYQAYDDTRFEVVLTCGLPAAGKDTWIRTNLPDWPVVSLDALRSELGIDPEDNQGRVLQAAKERARVFLREKRSFAWNATNVMKPRREQLVDLFTGYGARVRILYVEAPWTEILRRNRERAEVVPESVIRNMAARLDLPDATEADQVVYDFDGHPTTPRLEREST